MHKRNKVLEEFEFEFEFEVGNEGFDELKFALEQVSCQARVVTVKGEGGGLRGVGEFRKALSGIEFDDSLREKGEQREPYPNSTLYALFFFFVIFCLVAVGIAENSR
ncbi:hypothetical protein VNO80_00126 [Phaseolus coccineus]|uniref:Uncharacterized protein n=1 Tax=Phaseolus coccineus TaxID=3886 RepID=A0AAN9NZH6_PHACN